MSCRPSSSDECIMIKAFVLIASCTVFVHCTEYIFYSLNSVTWGCRSDLNVSLHCISQLYHTFSYNSILSVHTARSTYNNNYFVIRYRYVHYCIPDT